MKTLLIVTEDEDNGDVIFAAVSAALRGSRKVIVERRSAAAARMGAVHMQSVRERSDLAAGRAMARVLSGKEPGDISDKEAREALENYRECKDEELRNRAARAGIRAQMTEFAGSYFDQCLAGELIDAFQALDVGGTRGIAVATKNGRRAGAKDYDDLARFIASEVAFVRAALDITSNNRALTVVTGLVREGTKKPLPPYPGFPSAPLKDAGASWEQLRRLFDTGRELLGETGWAKAAEAGRAVKTGEAPEADFQGYRNHWLRAFGSAENVRKIVKAGAKSKPAVTGCEIGDEPDAKPTSIAKSGKLERGTG